MAERPRSKERKEIAETVEFIAFVKTVSSTVDERLDQRYIESRGDEGHSFVQMSFEADVCLVAGQENKGYKLKKLNYSLEVDDAAIYGDKRDKHLGMPFYKVLEVLRPGCYVKLTFDYGRKQPYPRPQIEDRDHIICLINHDHIECGNWVDLRGVFTKETEEFKINNGWDVLVGLERVERAYDRDYPWSIWKAARK